MPAPPMDPYLADYARDLCGKAPGTQAAYLRALRQFMLWIAQRPNSDGVFHATLFTRNAMETYLTHLGHQGYSASHRTLVKAAANGFARWLMDRGELQRNPTWGIVVPAQPLLAPRVLSDDQRYALRELVERHGGLRGEAIFALGYWAGCRVSDVSWLKRQDVHVGPRTGWLKVGHKGGKTREIDLINQARRPLYDFLESAAGCGDGPFVFPSQRAERLTEAGIHHWFRALKEQAPHVAWDLLHDVTFHDLRHDFAHRARASGWMLEEIAFYLGHVTRRGTPAVQTTVRYTQASRAQIKQKLSHLTG